MSEEKLSKLLERTASRTPSGLPERIILFLETKMKARARTRAILYCVCSAVSGIALYASGQAFVARLQASGSGRIFSLVFSDFQSVVANWKYFLMSLFESLPVTSLILALIAAGALFAMVVLAITDFKKAGGIDRAILLKNV